MPELIVAAAIKRKDGLVCFVEKPGRHHNVIHKMAAAGFAIPIKGEQGFVTSHGRFVGREEARKIASEALQIIASCPGPDGVPFTREHPQLFSEDVW